MVSFSMAGMCRGQNCQFLHDWNVTWSKWSVSAWLKYVIEKNDCTKKKRTEEEEEEDDW
jgi:hypothetical protein